MLLYSISKPSSSAEMRTKRLLVSSESGLRVKISITLSLEESIADFGINKSPYGSGQM